MRSDKYPLVGRRAVLGGTAAGVGAVLVGAGTEVARATGSRPAAEAAATGISWPAVQAQLAAVNPHVTKPISGVVTNKYTPGMLLGNGDIGVVVGDSSATQQTFSFGKSDFWGSDRKTTSPLVWQPSILPVGKLTVAASGASAASSGYSMTTDLAGATVTSVLALSNATVTMTSWTADNDSVLITQLSSKAGSSSVSLTATVTLPVDSAYPSGAGALNGTQLWLTRQNNTSGNGNVSMQATAASATQLVGAKFTKTSTSKTSSQTSATGTFTLAGGATATLVTAFRSHAQDVSDSSTAPTPTQLRDQAVTASSAIDAAWITGAASTHAAFWQDFWTRSSVVVGDSQLEAFYFNAQYVLGSATRSGVHNPPSLWGQWLTNDTPNWGGRYFLNYNQEALYYGAFSSNHAELSEPYRRLIYNEVPWQRNTTHGAGYQGTAFQRSMAPFHMYENQPSTAPVASKKDYTKLPADQKSNGTFAALPLIWHWEYTRDTTYLQTQLYPLLKELDAFWRDFAVFDGKRYVFQHSSAHEGGDDTNPNLDLGFARKVINTLLETSAILGVDANMQSTWQDFLTKLSAYPTGTYNGVTVFYTAEVINNPSLPNKFEPGNQPINMEGVIFPGEQCSIGGDANLLQYAINSLTQMNSWGVTSGGNSNNGFCKEFTIAARVGWPAEDLVQKLKAAIAHLWRSSNDTDFQGGGGIETSGTIETLNSMLMQSEAGAIRVFPCWPTARDGSFTLLAKGAFLVSSAISGGSVASVGIISQTGGSATLVLPWHTGTATVTANGSSVPVTVSGGRATFATTAGTMYKVTP
ncbi:glycosyl hydrolase family 95 catalytic domain-containing protein [Catenulispora rubra]|uniref:glycosyl hydrolase family 95 catalytic domain-containing protein n=1 Tax=Catenulispora rubra TaxID=280293 RepID=UPI0018927358|nr:hypothetical protein [Catenulispora rubra]